MRSREFSLISVLSDTFGRLPSLALPLLLISCVLSLGEALSLLLPQEAAAGLRLGFVFLNLYSVVVVSQLTWQSLQGESTDLKRALDGNRLGDIFGTGIVANILTALGLVALVIPGLMLCARWALWTPVVMFEKQTGLDALKRSSELTAGHRWQMLALVVPAFMVPFSLGVVGEILFPAQPALNLALAVAAYFVNLCALSLMVVAYWHTRPATEDAPAEPIGLTPAE